MGLLQVLLKVHYLNPLSTLMNNNMEIEISKQYLVTNDVAGEVTYYILVKNSSLNAFKEVRIIFTAEEFKDFVKKVKDYHPNE